MNTFSKWLPWELLLFAVFSLTANGASMTNLVPWFDISNRWNAVSTNEIVSAATKGDVEAECYLGMAYFHGLRGFATNLPAARQWMLKSAGHHSAQAQNTLGWQAANGIGMATNHDEAIGWYRKSADQGFSRAEMNLARIYRNGAGVAQDMPQALEWYRKAAGHGFRFAKSELGFVLSDEPNLGPGERREGRKWLREAAEEGDANAQNRLGWNYWKGLGLPQSDNEAQYWFTQSAEQGSTLAMWNLYLLAGKAQDLKTLTNLFGLVMGNAEHGYASAQTLVARMYAGGVGVSQDRSKEIIWYEKAAAQDYGPALEAAGDWYHNSGPTQDRKKAFSFYQRAAAQGLLNAQARVAELMLNGEGGLLNEKEGLAMLQTVADAGDVSAQYDLATRYREGRGLAKNLDSAIHWYSRLAERTNWVGTVQNWSAMILGIMSATGDGVARDDAKALRWFRIGANFNGQDAQDSLGYCYATGRGVAQNDSEAVMWFRAAAREEDTNDQSVFYPAVANLGVMYALGRGSLETNMEKAVALFESATSHKLTFSCNVPHAQTALAMCLYEANGTKRDVARAFELFHVAADNGNPQAQLHVGVLYWRGEGATKDPTNAFVYLEAAAGSSEPDAAEWRDRVSKELTDDQRVQATARARSITTEQPTCGGIHGHRTWNRGLRLPNLAVTALNR
jgi:TPR repeat protein